MALSAVITVNQVWEVLYPYRRGDAPPPPVLCVNERGKAVRQGVAVTWRHHTGVIDVGVLARPDDWAHGWWWPLDRVLWEVKEADHIRG
jgi:hypothetical protein